VFLHQLDKKLNNYRNLHLKTCNSYLRSSWNLYGAVIHILYCLFNDIICRSNYTVSR